MLLPWALHSLSTCPEPLQQAHLEPGVSRPETRLRAEPGSLARVPRPGPSVPEAWHAAGALCRTRHSWPQGRKQAVPGTLGQAAAARGREGALQKGHASYHSLERVLRVSRTRVVSGWEQGSRVVTLSCDTACHVAAAPRALGDQSTLRTERCVWRARGAINCHAGVPAALSLTARVPQAEAALRED